MSRAFLCTLAAVAITIFAWFSPWVWPAWPALAVLDLAFTPERPFAELGPWAKALVIMGLIAFNVGFWSTAIQVALQLLPVAWQVELKRQSLKRKHPNATPEEIETLMVEWLRTRPGG